nr:MAG TPA: hypothetical protein [Caudoviricetes sp.]
MLLSCVSFLKYSFIVKSIKNKILLSLSNLL